MRQPDHAVGHVRDETSVAGTRRRLDAMEAERDDLRATVEAQGQQILVTTDRLRTLERLWQTIQQGRAYRFLRLAGRWRWVDQLLAGLPRPDAPTDSTLEDVSGFPVVVGLSHNIPGMLPANVGHVAAFRIRNVGSQPIYVPSQHSAPWAANVPAKHHRIDVHLDGRLLLSGEVPTDCIEPGACVTVFFPLRSGREGQHRLQIVLVACGAAADAGDDRTLFDIGYRVTSTASRLGPIARLKHGVFMLRYAEWPVLIRRVRFRYARAVFRLAGRGASRRVHLRRWKDENRQLAFIERQTRKQRVASLPCYLTIDTTVRCNLRCPLCFRQYAGAAEALQVAEDMRDDVMDEIIRTLLPTAYTINPSGCGEPLLSPHLDNLLDACRRFDVYLSLVTNGTLLNRRGLLERLIPVLHRLEISVDSANRETFERLRAGARFEHVLENARTVGRIRSSLPDPKFSFGFSMTLYRENLEEIPDLLRLVADCGGNFLRTDIGVIFSKSELHRSVLRCPEAYNDACVKAEHCASELGLTLLMKPPFVDAGESEATRYGVCEYLYTHACIAADGSFKPCFSVVNPAHRPATTHAVASLWNSKEMRNLRSGHDTESAPEMCRRCYMLLHGRDSLSRRTELFVRGDAVTSSFDTA